MKVSVSVSVPQPEMAFGTMGKEFGFSTVTSVFCPKMSSAKSKTMTGVWSLVIPSPGTPVSSVTVQAVGEGPLRSSVKWASSSMPPLSGLPSASWIVSVPFSVTVYWPSSASGVVNVTTSVLLPQPLIALGVTGEEVGSSTDTSESWPKAGLEKLKVNCGVLSLVISSPGWPVSSERPQESTVGPTASSVKWTTTSSPPLSGLPAASSIVPVPFNVTVYWPSTINGVVNASASVSVPQPAMESGVTGWESGFTTETSASCPRTSSEKVNVSRGVRSPVT